MKYVAVVLCALAISCSGELSTTYTEKLNAASEARVRAVLEKSGLTPKGVVCGIRLDTWNPRAVRCLAPLQEGRPLIFDCDDPLHCLPAVATQ